ncbi:Pentatricopeptide repeat-containing protein [Diplonema papillatum]|nr:Pentatricopeptide repeat-containing protein [Diplonema papillatum]
MLQYIAAPSLAGARGGVYFVRQRRQIHPGRLRGDAGPAGGQGGSAHGSPQAAERKWNFVTRPDTSNKVRMVRDGWDEHDTAGRLVKSVRQGRVVFAAETPLAQKRAAAGDALQPPAGPATSSPRSVEMESRQQLHQRPAAADDQHAHKDPWKPDGNGIWYSAITQQPLSNDKYLIYPGHGKRVEDVLKEMNAGNLISWKPKRNRKPIIILDSKWSGWHEIQWDGVVIKTIREKHCPHPEKPDSLRGTPLDEEYQIIRQKMTEDSRERKLADLAHEEAASKRSPPKDDLEFDGKKLISLVNSSDNMLVRAYLVFKFMERKGLVATAVTFNSLLTACLNTCQFEMGLNVWRMMLSRGLLPDQQSYNTLVSLSSKCGQRDYAFRVFEEMVEYGIEPDRACFSALLSADAKRSFVIVKRMQKEGRVVPETVLLRMYCDAEDTENAFELWKTMQTMRRPPAVDDYNGMLLLCERRNDYDKAISIFNDMEERTVAPNFLTYNTVMNMMAIRGDTEKLHKVQTMMHDRKVTTLVVLSTFKYRGKETSIVNGVNMDLSVSLDVPVFDGEQDIAMSLTTLQMVQHLEYNSDYAPNFKGLPTYTLLHLGNEYNQRASLQFHCEKKSLAYLMLKHGKTMDSAPPKQLPRINVNARMCMDCHDLFANASRTFNVRIEVNDNNMLHVFEHGEDLSCETGWRTRDAINVPGSGQYGGGL